jgi:hypothetical protein
VNRRDFLKGTIAWSVAIVAGQAMEVKAEEPIEVESRPMRPKNIRHVVWPLQTDFEGLKLLDPVAAKKFADGWKDYKEPAELKDADDPVLLEESFQHYINTEKPRFAKTETGGWVIDGEELGYNPRDKYWTYFEYDEYDGYEVFGRGPRHLGYEPNEPILCFHFTAEEATKHRDHCLAHMPLRHPEVHYT